jgi:DNA-binding NtrC family response regulator
MNEPGTVLLVDDIPEYLDTMEINLPDGCRALRALSSEHAKRLVDSERPTVAVIDIRLVESEDRNQEGLALLKWIRERHPGVVVIMISAYREFEYAAESLAMGAEYFLRKPIQPDEFRQAVASALGRGK